MAAVYTEVLCIGVGMSGVCLGAQLQRKFGFTDIHFYERNAYHSGTWLVNRYPGCACDVPAILYSFSFEPNASWTRLLPPGDEIRRYIDGVVTKYNLLPHISWLTECEWAEWDETRQIWTVHLRDLISGKKYTHECRLLFSAVGVLVEPKEPTIPRKETFEGPIFHTARWRSDVDLHDKSVILIGNGCSGTQVVPAITPEVKTLTQFIRTPNWILERENTKYGPGMQWALQRMPFFARLLRFCIFMYLEIFEWRLFPGDELGARLRRGLEEESKTFVRRVAPKKYHDLLIPEWAIGCKRRVFDTDSAYLKSLHSPNVHLTNDPIVEIVPTGIRTASRTYPADVIIMATGFHTNNGLGPLQIRGRGGVWLHDYWKSKGGPGAYNNTAVHGFPNFMMIIGPNSATGYSSVLLAIENMVNYSLKIFEPILKGEAKEVEVRAEAEAEYLRRLHVASVDKVWNEACGNWYVTPEGWNSTMYPWSQMYSWWRSTFPIHVDWVYRGTMRRHSGVSRLLKRKVIFALALLGTIVAVLGGSSRGVGWHVAFEYASAYVQMGRTYLGA